jgi:hypothetical protein
VSSLIEGLGMPETPTPSTWENPTLLNASLESEEPEDGESAAPNVLKETLEVRNRGSVLPSSTEAAAGRQGCPLSDINNQTQSLASNVEKINKEEQTQQGTLETLCPQLTQAFGRLKAEQQEKEQMYCQRLAVLEQRVAAQDNEIEDMRAEHKAPGEPTPGSMSPPHPVAPTIVMTPQGPGPAIGAVNAREQGPKTLAAPSTGPQRQPERQGQRSYATAARSVAAKSKSGRQ